MLAWCSFYSDTAPSGNTSAPGRPERARAATTPHSGHGSGNSASSRCSSFRSRDGGAGSWRNAASAAPPSKSERLHSATGHRRSVRRRTQPTRLFNSCSTLCCHTKIVAQQRLLQSGRNTPSRALPPGRATVSTTPPPSTTRPATRPEMIEPILLGHRVILSSAIHRVASSAAARSPRHRRRRPLVGRPSPSLIHGIGSCETAVGSILTEAHHIITRPLLGHVKS